MIHSRARDGGVGTRARARGDETCGDDDAIDDDGSSRGALDRARATRGGGRDGIGIGIGRGIVPRVDVFVAGRREG